MRANITIFIDPRQEFDGRLNGFVWVLDYELPSAFVWLIVSLWVMSPCVTGDGQIFIKPRLEPLIGQGSSGRRLIGPWCPVICVQRVSVRAGVCPVCPHSIISRQMTCSSLYHMSTPLEREQRCAIQAVYNLHDWWHDFIPGECLQPIRCRGWGPATNQKSDLIAWGEPRVSPCSAAQSGYSKLMINQDLENIKNMQLSTLSVVLVVEQDKKQNTVRGANMISGIFDRKEQEKTFNW